LVNLKWVSERKEQEAMSLRKITKIPGISPTYLSLLLNRKRPWRGNLKERYEELVNPFVTTPQANTSLTKASEDGNATEKVEFCLL